MELNTMTSISFFTDSLFSYRIGIDVLRSLCRQRSAASVDFAVWRFAVVVGVTDTVKAVHVACSFQIPCDFQIIASPAWLCTYLKAWRLRHSVTVNAQRQRLCGNGWPQRRPEREN
jgi:hypothetical protein